MAEKTHLRADKNFLVGLSSPADGCTLIAMVADIYPLGYNTYYRNQSARAHITGELRLTFAQKVSVNEMGDKVAKISQDE